MRDMLPYLQSLRQFEQQQPLGQHPLSDFIQQPQLLSYTNSSTVKKAYSLMQKMQSPQILTQLNQHKTISEKIYTDCDKILNQIKQQKISTFVPKRTIKVSQKQNFITFSSESESN